MADLSSLTADQLAEKVLLPLNRRIPGTGFEYREALVSLTELQTRANQRDEARADTQKVWDTLEAEVKARKAAENQRDEALITARVEADRGDENYEVMERRLARAEQAESLAQQIRNRAERAEARLAETLKALEPDRIEEQARMLAGEIHVHGAIPARFWKDAIRAALATHPEGKP